MTTAEIAKGLVDMCRQGKNLEAIDKFYAPDIVSVESFAPPGMSPKIKGLEAVRGKNQWWYENHEIHSSEANGPYIGENEFAVEFKTDITQKFSGKRLQMSEMGLYKVEGGKIVYEHFFYPSGEPAAA